MTGPQFHLTYEDDNHVDELLSEQEPLQWIRRAFQGGKYQVTANFSYDETAVEPILKSLPFLREGKLDSAAGRLYAGNRRRVSRLCRRWKEMRWIWKN